MYYEESIINGVLCYRLTPDGIFRQFTKEQLTQRCLEEEQRAYRLQNILDRNNQYVT